MQGAKWHKWPLLLAFVLGNLLLQAQAPTVTLTCREKAVQLGRPFEIELTVRHPERMVVVFPDTSMDFKPYEVASGIAVPANTDDGNTEDGRIYKIYTWEIDSVQHLQFPVYYVTPKGDTEQVLSNVIDVEFLPMIAAYSDTLKLKKIADLAVVREPINWVAWGIILSTLLILVIVAVLVFSKPVIKMMRRAKIQREWRKYLGQLQGLKPIAGDRPNFYAGLNKVWRGYFDRSWTLALGSLTSQELAQTLEDFPLIEEDDRIFLVELSQNTDMLLYAGQDLPSAQSAEVWQRVERIMTKEFQRRKEAVEL